jgi:nitrogen fixation/metabolism regulation signal transduction histidine kinase
MVLQKLRLGTKIHIANLVLLVASFVFIGISTYYNINKQNDTYHRSRLERKEKSLVKNVEYHLASISQYVNEKNFLKHFDYYTLQLSDINNIDINFYSINGDALIISKPKNFEKHKLPKQLSPELIKTILKDGEITKEEKNDIGRYFSSYYLIKNKKGRNLAILNVPYFDFDRVKKNDLNAYFGNLALIYIILFGLAVIVGFILTKVITEPLRTLSEDIKQMELSEESKPLNWHVDDEIGVLIKEYNKTKEKLRISADLLAQKEREGAWREMAKQIAHEVKNPLTPMKLQVQFISKFLKPDTPNFDEELKDFSQSLIDQIDNMTNIANAFSNFASLPKMQFEELNAHLFLKQIQNFYKSQNLKFTTPESNVFIWADKHQLTQVFNNLIKNAYQAIPEDRIANIEIGYTVFDNTLQIFVKDNGIGIPEENQQKVFEPKFTTKNSGKGLGLAMVKNIILAHQGKISFYSELNKGTIFTIQIPKRN